ncbi:unnamed protein product [Protopolystoma xenopodis]|uniref:Uncharacterized protein n=1 Tax=Protopolystoma xenopodis TaxID=117903 RepID=A0A448WQ01_9PLAT|nr:unnamed protein product [Protopolystoma xenopodis]
MPIPSNLPTTISSVAYDSKLSCCPEDPRMFVELAMSTDDPEQLPSVSTSVNGFPGLGQAPLAQPESGREWAVDSHTLLPLPSIVGYALASPEASAWARSRDVLFRDTMRAKYPKSLISAIDGGIVSASEALRNVGTLSGVGLEVGGRSVLANALTQVPGLELDAHHVATMTSMAAPAMETLATSTTTPVAELAGDIDSLAGERTALGMSAVLPLSSGAGENSSAYCRPVEKPLLMLQATQKPFLTVTDLIKVNYNYF